MNKLKQTIIRIGHKGLVLWWFLARPNTRGVKCLVVSGDNVLLVKQSYGDDRWSIPGGGVKRTETYYEAASRELKEETGLHSELKCIGEYSQFIDYKKDVVEVYLARLPQKPIVIIDQVEIIEYGWFSINDLPEVRPSVQKIISIYEQ